MNLGATSRNGEEFAWCCLVGGAVGEIVIGIHLLRFGDLEDGLWRGSKSRLLLRVAQAILAENV